MLNKLVLLLIPTLIFAKTLESDRLATLLDHHDENTWVVFDVDNTLLEATTHMGSDQWARYLDIKVLAAGYTEEERENIQDSMWRLAQLFINVRLIEPNTPEFIRQIPGSVFALTARDPLLVNLTHEHLESVNIAFQSQESCTFPLDKPNRFERGILFSGENKKSELLEALFNKVGKPKRLIFIDDKWSHIKDVERLAQKLNIDYVGIRYSGADERVKSFDPKIADIQWQHLPTLLSDEEALKLLAKP